MKKKIKENIDATAVSRRFCNLLVLLATFFVVILYPCASLTAQSGPALGEVWDKTYGNTEGKVGNIYPNKYDANYTAIAVEGNYIGKIYEINESGTALRTFTVDVRTGAYPTSKTPTITNFAGVTLEGGIAFKTDDGGVLAFFNVYDKNRPAGDRQPNWNGEANQLKYGIWVVKMDADGVITNQRIDRGTVIFDGLQLSDGRFMVGGMDENVSSTGEARNVTLLRIYAQTGIKETDFRGDVVNGVTVPGAGFNIKEVVSLHMAAKQNPGDPDHILVATILYLARIDDLNNTTAPAISYPLDGVVLPGGGPTFNNPNIQSMTPTSDGGMFVESFIRNQANQNNTYTAGRALVKFMPSGSNSFTPIYARKEIPGSTSNPELQYYAPYLLPNGHYGGVVQYKANNAAARSSYIYELKDLGTSGEIKPTPGTPGAGWTSLNGDLVVKRSSKVDGFFAVGKDKIQTPNRPNIVKLSTCANFFINNVPAQGYYFVKPRAAFNLNEMFTYQGASASQKSNVKYEMTVSVLSGVVDNKTAGETLYSIPLTEALTFTSGATGSHGNMVSVDDLFTVSGNQPVVQYTIASEDHYEISSVPQTCMQTTVFYLVQELYGGVTRGPLYVASGSPLPSTLYVEDSSGGFGANTYQWQEYNGSTWVNITGATDVSYFPSGNMTASKQFRRVIINSVGTAYSTPFTVNVMSLANIDVVSLPTGAIEGNDLIIKTAVKNISPIATTAPFKITVYKNVAGNATKFTFTDSSNSIAYNETKHYTITIPDYAASWSDASQIIVSFNDNGNTAADLNLGSPQNLGDAILQIKN